MTREVLRNRATVQQRAQRTLADEERILDRLATDLRNAGLAGEERAAKLVYLVLTSRLLDRPISAVLKAPSAAGKSYLVDTGAAPLPAIGLLHRLGHEREGSRLLRGAA